MFTAGWGLGSEARVAMQAKKGRDPRKMGTAGDDDGAGGMDETDIWSGPQTEEYIRQLKGPFAIAKFGGRELLTSVDVRGIITEGDKIIAGQEHCVVKQVLKDRIVIEEPYMGGFIGKELRLSIIETVVRGQPPATDEERMVRLDPVVGDMVRRERDVGVTGRCWSRACAVVMPPLCAPACGLGTGKRQPLRAGQ